MRLNSPSPLLLHAYGKRSRRMAHRESWRDGIRMGQWPYYGHNCATLITTTCPPFPLLFYKIIHLVNRPFRLSLDRLKAFLSSIFRKQLYNVPMRFNDLIKLIRSQSFLRRRFLKSLSSKGGILCQSASSRKGWRRRYSSRFFFFFLSFFESRNFSLEIYFLIKNLINVVILGRISLRVNYSGRNCGE